MPLSVRHALLPLALSVLAAVVVVLHVRIGHRSQSELYQIGDQEFLSMNSGSNEDLALAVERVIAKEKVLLKQVAKRAEKHQRVDINIKAGQIGIRGRPGPRGYEGPKGFPGERGRRGYRGRRGPTGPMGPRGIKGIKGEDGDPGRHGARGKTGARGAQGPRGRRGREGRRGEEGKLGKNGPNGAPGKMGIMGIPGPAAYDGIRGPPGPPGAPGAPGYTGNVGIGGDKGPPGQAGNDGARGSPGPQGTPGEAGKSQCGLATTTGKQMCCGSVPAADFVYDGANVLHIDVDTHKCRFTGQPFYFAQINGEGGRELIYTVQNIVNPDRTPDEVNPSKFRVFLRNGNNDGKLQKYVAISRKYSLEWCGFGSTGKMAPSYAMCCGSSRSNSWKSYSNGAYLDVNTAGCGWGGGDTGWATGPLSTKQKPPIYFTSLKDTANGASASARSVGVWSATQTQFRTHLVALPGQAKIHAGWANSANIDVEWCAVKPVQASTNGKAGYPCTAPRVLVGNGDQAVQTNHAKICCEKSSASGWVAATGASAGKFIEKTIDISACNMKKVHVTMVDMRGDQGSIEHTGGGAMFSVGTDAKKMKVKVWVKGTYKFYDAERYHWHAQYCLIGT